MPLKIKLNFEPRDPFLPFLTRKERFGCLVAHRRSGKSYHSIMDMVGRAMTHQREGPPCRYALIGPTRDQIKNIAWQYVKQFTQDIPAVKYNEQDLMVTLPNNATIRLYSGDSYERLRGIYLDGVVLDEISDIDPQAWYSVIRPTLLDYKGWCIFSGTPKGRGFLWRMWAESTRNPDWFSLMLKASESNIIDAGELESIRAGTPEHLYRQEMECDFSVGRVGAIYARLLDDLRNKQMISDNIMWFKECPVYTSWDVGAPLNTRVWCFQLIGDRIVMLECLFGDHHCGTPSEWVNRLLAKPYRYGGNFIPHDAATDNGSLWEGQLKGAGLQNVRAVPRQISVWDGVNLALESFPRLSFNESACEQGIDALDQYHSKEESDGITIRSLPVHDHASHAADAFSLAFQAIKHGLIVDRSQIPTQVQRWRNPIRPQQATMGFRG